MAGRHRDSVEGDDAEVAAEQPPATGWRRRGLRPLSVLALCCVVAVAAVLVTQAAHPYGGMGGGSVAIATDNGDGSTSDAGGDDGDPTTDPTTDAASGTATDDPTSPGPAAPLPAPQPPPPAAAPPTRGAPAPAPSPSPAPLPSPSPPVTVSYEAEASANTKSGTRSFTCGPCSGGKKVGDVGDGGTLQFNGVTGGNGGTVPVTIYFVNGNGPRTAQLSVNGAASVTISFPGTRDWNTVGTLTLYVTLNSGGGNRLKFFNDGAMAPDFDRITVRT